MNKPDYKIIADFSDTVRESTLKRLKTVPEGKENFRLHEKSMSISDIAKHLIDCDKSLIKAQSTKYKGKCLGKANSMVIRDRKEYEKLITELTILKSKRREFILALNNHTWLQNIQVDSISGKRFEHLGLLIHKMLDHEAHHRGQISVLLKFVM